MKELLKTYESKGLKYGSLYSVTSSDGSQMFVYESHRNRAEHFMRKYKGWGIEDYILRDLREFPGTQIHILVEGEGILTTSAKDFYSRGFKDSYPPFGVQIFLPEKHFRWLVRNGVNSLDVFV